MSQRLHASWGDSHLWDQEYAESKVIPSSTRDIPAKALQQYSELLDFGQYSPVLDIGCGNGRNAIYLAGKGCNGIAVDASGVAIRIAQDAANRAKVADKITMLNTALAKEWPFRDGQFALALDSYVFCHILEENDRIAFRRELRRITRPGGIAYTAAFAVDDEYYASFSEANVSSSMMVCDPVNGLAKRLYTPSEYAKFFSAEFSVHYQTQFYFYDVVLGRRYRRSVLTLLLKV